MLFRDPSLTYNFQQTESVQDTQSKMACYDPDVTDDRCLSALIGLPTIGPDEVQNVDLKYVHWVD